MEDVDVEDDDVVIWDEPLALLSMFFISAMELLISPRSCLMASVDEVVADEEADLEEEDIERWVADVSQAILHDALVVLLLVDEDVLELLVLLEVAFRSSCDEEMLALESIPPVDIVVVAVVDPAVAVAADDDALDELKKLCPRRRAVDAGIVGVPLAVIAVLLLPSVSAKSDISRRGNRNCDLSFAMDGLG